MQVDGALDDANTPPPEDAYTLTVSPLKAPNGANLQAADADGNATLTFSDGQLSQPSSKSANW